MPIFRPPKKQLSFPKLYVIPLKTQGICANLLNLFHLHSISKSYPFGAMQSQVLDGFGPCFSLLPQQKVHQGIQHPSE